ncbi:uncharacterized protein LOC101750509 isoform X2 [Gallus gallus]|uniref:uncharacterized protein LOC101750509 isoform X2 n=1 Tax=Gallus gallus TaxID=9031 RepID=UPI000D63FDFF|nr:uncharacterized protein LOC101750509 isoform X2 [Gallus gallus]XP_040515945.1 uncharacterized protein LOC101750509 isoform X2 [Gallus gallus]|eukprot:XP_025002385.1 uncharacterized protein LOC101750509 isoform X2 [Gallus gallus]
MRSGILFMISYLVNITASSGPELLVLQYPEDASVLLNSTVWMLCVFEYPKEENEEPVVYWRKGPSCDNQQSLRSSSGAGRPHIHIIKDIFRGFSILKLSSVDKNDSSSYFCDVILTQKTHGKCGKGTKLTVHGKGYLIVTEIVLMDTRFHMQRLYKIRTDLVVLVPSSWIHSLCHHSYHSFWYSSVL